MANTPKDRRPNRVPAGTDPRVGGHDQQRDAPDGIVRGKGPSDLAMRQPNERDEAADPDAIGPRDIGRQAAADVAAGRTDTDRRSAGTDTIEPEHSNSKGKP
jgi:hypothetical protein